MTGLDRGPILITGAAGGIGSAITRQLVKRGADVIASDRDPAQLAMLSAKTGCRSLAFDLTSEESIAQALGELDLYGLVNCAGWGGIVEPVLDAEIATFDTVIAVNTRGPLLVTKYAARSMIRLGKGGAIVNVSSQAALVALQGHGFYAASKAALDSITRVSALELGRHAIRVNSVAPTVVMTDMSASYWGRPEIGGPILATMPLGRWAEADEIAAPIVFLLSDGASMVTGVTLPVDGGFSAC